MVVVPNSSLGSPLPAIGFGAPSNSDMPSFLLRSLPFDPPPSQLWQGPHPWLWPLGCAAGRGPHPPPAPPLPQIFARALVGITKLARLVAARALMPTGTPQCRGSHGPIDTQGNHKHPPSNLLPIALHQFCGASWQ